jgi:hypothetical protein
MKILFSWFLYILFPFQNFALERIWLVRHCDKPKDTNNPCCSEMGYQRANMWYQYFQSWLNPENKIKVITSRFNKKKVCIPNIDTNIENDSDNKCQKSQRMWITGFYIYRDLQIKFNLHSIMNTQYCIGQYKEMLKHILDKEKNKEKDDTTDAIIVWEHNEMIDIIQHFGIKIDKWKNENIYDIVFMMDVTKKPRLFYDCFSLEKDSDD